MPTCKPGVYVLTNKIEEIYYIGQTLSLSRRWSSYKMFLKKRKTNSLHRKLVALLDKHGPDSFEFTVLELCAPEMLIDREGFWIDSYRKQYQGLVANNEGPNDKPPMSEEIRRARSVAMKGVKRPDLSKKLKGRVFSEEHKTRISEAKKQHYALGGRNPSARYVTCIETGITFDTCLKAAEWVRNQGWPKANSSSIAKAGKGPLRTMYGFTWQYVDGDGHAKG